MKIKPGKILLYFLSGWLIKLVLLTGFVNAFQFSISTDNNDFDNTVKLYSDKTSRYESIGSAGGSIIYLNQLSNGIYSNGVYFGILSHGTNFISGYNSTTAKAYRDDLNTFTFATPLTGLTDNAGNSNFPSYYSFSLTDLSLGIQAGYKEDSNTLFSSACGYLGCYEPDLYLALIGNDFNSIYKYPTTTFSHIRLFGTDPFSVDFTSGESFVPEKLQYFVNSTTSYYRKDDSGNVYSRAFFEPNKGTHFLGYGNAYSYSQDLGTVGDTSISWNNLNFVSVKDWIRSDMSTVSQSSLEQDGVLILPSKGFQQVDGIAGDQTFVLAKSNQYLDRIQVTQYGCMQTSMELLANEDVCPVVANGWLKFHSTSFTPGTAYYQYDSTTYSGIHLLPFTDYTTEVSFAGSPIEKIFAGSNSDAVIEFLFDGTYLKFTNLHNLINSNFPYTDYIKFTIESDVNLSPVDVRYTAGTLGVFVPVVGTGIIDTGYIIPGQEGFVTSGDYFIVDETWTGFTENNLGSGFKAFICPYDYGFVSLKLSDIPGLGLLDGTSIDFDILKPISCIFSSYSAGSESMKTNTFPEIDLFSGNLIEQDNLLYEASSSAKDLFGVLFNLLLGFIGVYLFIKWIR